MSIRESDIFLSSRSALRGSGKPKHKGRAKHYVTQEELEQEETRKKREDEWKVRVKLFHPDLKLENLVGHSAIGCSYTARTYSSWHVACVVHMVLVAHSLCTYSDCSNYSTRKVIMLQHFRPCMPNW